MGAADAFKANTVAADVLAMITISVDNATFGDVVVALLSCFFMLPCA